MALLLRHQRPAWAGEDKPATASRRLELVLLATQEMSLERIFISAKPWKNQLARVPMCVHLWVCEVIWYLG